MKMRYYYFITAFVFASFVFPQSTVEGIVSDEVKAIQESVLEQDVKSVIKSQAKTVRKKTKNYFSGND